MTTQDSSATPHLPLFYREPVALSNQNHAVWRLTDGDQEFAATTPYVPIVAAEIAASARSYPVVFAASDAQPIAVLGLERANLFVADGRWAPDVYVPAYVRRYPFGFMATVEPEGFVLGIDAASPRVIRSGNEGHALFDAGAPGEVTRQALAFCDLFQAEAAATKAFTDALRTQDLLIDRRADATLPDGRKLGLDGFQIVDGEKFAALADEVVLDWHRRGWLALVHFHLASLERFSDLLARQGGRQPVAPSSHPNGSEAQSVPPAKTGKYRKS